MDSHRQVGARLVRHIGDRCDRTYDGPHAAHQANDRDVN